MIPPHKIKINKVSNGFVVKLFYMPLMENNYLFATKNDMMDFINGVYSEEI